MTRRTRPYLHAVAAAIFAGVLFMTPEADAADPTPFVLGAMHLDLSGMTELRLAETGPSHGAAAILWPAVKDWADGSPSLDRDDRSAAASLRERLGFTDADLMTVSPFTERFDETLLAQKRRGSFEPGGLRPLDRVGLRAGIRIADNFELSATAWTNISEGLGFDEAGVTFGTTIRF